VCVRIMRGEVNYTRHSMGERIFLGVVPENCEWQSHFHAMERHKGGIATQRPEKLNCACNGRWESVKLSICVNGIK